jgi:hypothetical protein
MEDLSSIRARLRRWRREIDNVISSSRDGDPQIPVDLGVPHAKIQIPAPNSIGQEAWSGDAAEQEMINLDVGPFDQYQDDGEAVSGLMSPGDMAQVMMSATCSPTMSITLTL